jgi:hypothetical protein
MNYFKKGLLATVAVLGMIPVQQMNAWTDDDLVPEPMRITPVAEAREPLSAYEMKNALEMRDFLMEDRQLFNNIGWQIMADFRILQEDVDHVKGRILWNTDEFSELEREYPQVFRFIESEQRKRNSLLGRTKAFFKRNGEDILFAGVIATYCAVVYGFMFRSKEIDAYLNKNFSAEFQGIVAFRSKIHNVVFAPVEKFFGLAGNSVKSALRYVCSRGLALTEKTEAAVRETPPLMDGAVTEIDAFNQVMDAVGKESYKNLDLRKYVQTTNVAKSDSAVGSFH